MKIIPTLLLVIVVWLSEWQARGTIYTASSPSLLDVSNAVAQTVSGDTVNVPAGTATWTSLLWITNNINLIGAGIDQTILIDELSRAATPAMIAWVPVAGGSCRLSGFTFKGGVYNTGNAENGTVNIDGFCHAVRVDHCKFDKVFNISILFGTWIYGVVDHCIFWRDNTFGVQIIHNRYGGYYYGDGSWADDDSFGTTNALYVEDCVFTNSYASPGAIDSCWGGRFVFRYNHLTNDNVSAHGTESTGRARSVRQYECYNNTMYFDTNKNTIWFAAFMFRGGSGVIFSNTLYGYNCTLLMANYRDYPVHWQFENVSGANPWDSNNPTIFDSGTATGTNNSPQLQDTTKNWTANEWQGYRLYDTNQNLGVSILSNNASTLYFNGTALSYGAAMVIATNDSYQIRQVLAAVDQCGRGKGDMLASYDPINLTTMTKAWPNEEYDPIYQWSNSLTGLIDGNSYVNAGQAEQPTIVSNRDWFDATPKPGYTPLVYPHPMVGDQNFPNITGQPENTAVLTNQTATFSVSATGSSPLMYKWALTSGGVLTNFNLSAVWTTNSLIAQTNLIWCVVTNAYGSVTSSPVYWSVTNGVVRAVLNSYGPMAGGRNLR